MKKAIAFFVFSIGLTIAAQCQDSTLAAYTGYFKFPDGSPIPTAEIKLVDSVLAVESPSGNSTLARIQGDLFSIVEYNGTAQFVRGEDKKIKGVRISVMGIELEGEKVPTPAIFYWRALTPIRM